VKENSPPCFKGCVGKIASQSLIQYISRTLENSLARSEGTSARISHPHQATIYDMTMAPTGRHSKERNFEGASEELAGSIDVGSRVVMHHASTTNESLLSAGSRLVHRRSLSSTRPAPSG
jgi:hypothetical protein